MIINIFLMFKRDNSIPLFNLLFSPHNIAIVGSCTNTTKAVETIAACEVKPDIVLMDANWTSNGETVVGLDLLKQFLALPQIKVIALTTHFEYRTSNYYKEHGAHGYAYRNSSETEIIKCIQNVYSGNYHFIYSKDTDKESNTEKK